MRPGLDPEGLDRYGRWRRQWRMNVDSQAIAILRHHGMARALELTAGWPSPPAPAPPDGGGTPPAFDPAPVMAEAAAMICALLTRDAALEGIDHV